MRRWGHALSREPSANGERRADEPRPPLGGQWERTKGATPPSRRRQPMGSVSAVATPPSAGSSAPKCAKCSYGVYGASMGLWGPYGVYGAPMGLWEPYGVCGVMGSLWGPYGVMGSL